MLLSSHISASSNGPTPWLGHRDSWWSLQSMEAHQYVFPSIILSLPLSPVSVFSLKLCCPTSQSVLFHFTQLDPLERASLNRWQLFLIFLHLMIETDAVSESCVKKNFEDDVHCPKYVIFSVPYRHHHQKHLDLAFLNPFWTQSWVSLCRAVGHSMSSYGDVVQRRGWSVDALQPTSQRDVGETELSKTYSRIRHTLSRPLKTETIICLMVTLTSTSLCGDDGHPKMLQTDNKDETLASTVQTAVAWWLQRLARAVRAV